MRVEECYAQMGGDYADTLGRLGNDERIRKYLEKFLKDQNFASLCTALDEKDCENAFVHIHNLKGICSNLGLAQLAKSSSILCDELRKKVFTEEISQMLEAVRKDYVRTADAIRCLLTEN